MKRHIIAFSLILILFIAGCPRPPQPKEPVYSTGAITQPKGLFASIPETKVEVIPIADSYELPIELDEITNYNRDVLLNFSLTYEGELKLMQEGFVAIEGDKIERFSSAYQRLSRREIPIFITTDSTLHLYHIFYSQILKNVEIKEFIPMLKVITKGLVETSWAQYEGSEGKLKEAAKKNVAYLSVAAKLLEPNFTVPGIVANQVNEQIRLIEEHKGFDQSPIFSEGCPCDPCSQLPPLCIEPNCYCEDYSQYVPRGHYTQTEDLKRYFKAMMWFGRLGLRIKSDRETIQAILLTDALKSTKVNYNGEEVEVSDLWHRIYKVTSFFVGAADDLTFYEYDKAAVELFGEEFSETILEQGTELAKLKERLRELRKPKIMSGFVLDILDLTEETQGLRFMGQRYVPDSYMLGQTCYKHVGPNPELAEQYGIVAGFVCEGSTFEQWNAICWNALQAGHPEVCRFMPKGLDVMAVLGSSKADELLEEDNKDCNYTIQMNKLKEEFSQYTKEEWAKNMYLGWLYSLKPLLKDFGEGYPVWMQTDAWKGKELHTALTSWAELRHDTILYVKQSYTYPTVGAIMPARYYGYVEPVPEFYARLRDLTSLTKQGLKDLDVLDERQEQGLKRIEELLAKLKIIAEKELTNKELSEEEYNEIEAIGDTFERIIEEGARVITVEEGTQMLGMTTERRLNDEAFKTTIIADVHTESNTKTVLEEGSGYVDWIIVVHKSKDGSLGAAAGPIFSYYEFAHPMSDRLTDEAWRELLSTEPPERPNWISEFYE